MKTKYDIISYLAQQMLIEWILSPRLKVGVTESVTHFTRHSVPLPKEALNFYFILTYNPILFNDRIGCLEGECFLFPALLVLDCKLKTAGIHPGHLLISYV